MCRRRTIEMQGICRIRPPFVNGKPVPDVESALLITAAVACAAFDLSSQRHGQPAVSRWHFATPTFRRRSKMTHARSLIALAVVAAFTSVASAQTTTPPARADVKADAKAAVKSGKTAEGELKDGSASAPTGMSDKSRTDVKSEANAAVKSGATAEGEKGGTSYSGPDKGVRTTSTASRTDVKGKATSAVSAPAGESKTQNTERTVAPQNSAPGTR
jgi:hypothetical protein